ncbi:MAG: glycoside hydrolase family 3 N-terminal domain-containing protein [Clostridia bacterium]|nr:glycoside hydrolase family 3 N-terminal domain-containing protein [Clostridia bacterium]
MKRILTHLLSILLCTVILTGCSSPVKNSVVSQPESLLETMTLEEKVYQMLTVSPEALTGIGTATQAGDATKQALAKYPVGGIMYKAKNLESPEQTKTMITNTKDYAAIPPFMAVDEEGGAVARVADTLGTTKFSPMYDYRAEGAEKAYEIGATLARDIRQFGFNQNYAPVADVWTNPSNTVISTRAFSDNPDAVAERVAAAVRGLQENGVIATLKHFPGHGDTAEDSHTGQAFSYKTLEELRACEFIPFRAGIEAGADFIMCAHINVPAVDNLPATLSKTLVTDILRNELGFHGVIITDAMEMNAIAGFYSPEESAVLAINAGCDMILCPSDMVRAAEGILSAIQKGELTEARIDESVLRILTVKEKNGILQKD